jgi:hypothetical protein
MIARKTTRNMAKDYQLPKIGGGKASTSTIGMSVWLDEASSALFSLPAAFMAISGKA